MNEQNQAMRTVAASEDASAYPDHLIDAWNANGVDFVVRPILPHDRRALGRLILRLSAGSRYKRFHGVIRELPDDTLRAMTEVNYRDIFALVVTARSAPWHGLVVADARYVVDSDGRSAQFALVVDDPWQGCGLGLRVMRGIVVAAVGAGLELLTGSVLNHNTAMLALMRRCGFSCSPDPESPGHVHVEKRLTGQPPAPA